ncbi:MAG: phosphatase PAP2 family protein [Gammaproteobacteria bacterium]|nr:phosphatase PAP2 family protein [Gammaproteobacteria bacterium]MBU1602597.1 phosphatase PAP2 family protein [Gammaproteobacteria bacterium]MBU2433402.1 phosphatase PAP2 family protein [Gammaproteobacteria bacterium]MBU2451318.1 phosphatase PAP2 family protein [Gammaproteobacteria bacterium]
MNDQGLHARNPVFDASIAGLCLAFALGLVAIGLTGDWYSGFVPAQAASRVLPGWLWESLTTLGDGRVQLALMLPFCLRYPRVFWALVVGALLAGAMSRGLKIWFDLPRPAAVLDASQITIIGARLTAHSFPSGHTVSAFSFIVAWLALLGWRRALPIVVIAGLAGFSRIAVGAHWPVDVLAGALVGLAGGWLGLRLTRGFRWGLGIRAHWMLVVIAVIGVATLPFDGQGYPDTRPWRIVACLWGLGGFVLCYLRPLLSGGWQAANRPLEGLATERQAS